MMTLDASRRDVCSVRREKTSSPLQAMVLLNGPQFIEAARVLAEDVMHKHGSDRAAAIEEVFRRLTGRRPTPRETESLEALYRAQLADFEKTPARAESFLKVGEAPRDTKLPAAPHAAMAVVASTLINFDEFVMKR
jgi:hypothetical protein